MSESGESTRIDNQPSAKKRKRKTFSCYICRSRKLRCDRQYPVCTRCLKNDSTCIYETIPEPPVANGAATQSGARSLVPDRVSSHYQSPQVPRVSMDTQLNPIDPRLMKPAAQISKRPRLDGRDAGNADGNQAEGFIYGSGYQTAYFGPSSLRSAAAFYPAILSKQPELRDFLTFRNLSNPVFNQAWNLIHSLKQATKLSKDRSRSHSATLLGALPEKEVCVTLVTAYLDTIGKIYPIIHAPTFWSSFWSFWNEYPPRNESLACSILLMISCMNCLHQSNATRYSGLRTVAREQASHWVKLCEAWVENQSRKHLTIESFQHRILLCISKRINGIKMKQVWERASSLLSFAVSAGLHRDIAKSDETLYRLRGGDSSKPRYTVFEGEMRRRLWATIVEIEIQAAFEKGLPSSNLILQADCGSPALVLEEHLDERSVSIPALTSHARCEPTSYLFLSQATLILRTKLSEVVNGNVEQLSFDELLEYDEQITAAIGLLPSWAGQKTLHIQDQTSMYTAALCEVQLLQYRLQLHAALARQTQATSKANYARIVSLETSARILGLYFTLYASSRSEIPWLYLLRDDVFQAVLTICYVVVLWRGLDGALAVTSLKDAHLDLLHQGLALIKSKVLAIGEHYAQLWFAYASVGMVNTAFDPITKDAQMTKVASDLMNVFKGVSKAQEEQTSEQTAAGALTALATPSSTAFDVRTPTLHQPGMGDVPAYLDGIDMTSWAFEDLWPFDSTGLSW